MESSKSGRTPLKLTRAGALFTLVVPVPVAGIIPWFITHWAFQPAFGHLEALRFAGAVLIAAGIVMYAFALGHLGHHDARPFPPVARIVSAGIYGWMRNPMYAGVVAALTGQALLFGSRALLYYALGWFVAFHLFEVGYDERALTRQFPAVYPDYCERTPRWIPRRPKPRA
jgi:protein-S-isoprenylcysteine O-methyltransferase Ste14